MVRRYLSGETEAFAVLVARYERVLFSVALRMLRNRADAGDATQTTFAKVLENLARYDDRRRFFSWIYRILLNECMNMFRARRAQRSLVWAPSPTSDPFTELEGGERQNRVRRALQALTPGDRKIVVLRHISGHSYREIGTALDMPVGRVKSRLYAARQRLARSLAPRSPGRWS